jgi:hypothetical protein
MLADEIAAGTWDGQRMSSIDPEDGLGKLLGGTVYVWYCALLCLATYARPRLRAGSSTISSSSCRSRSPAPCSCRRWR